MTRILADLPDKDIKWLGQLAAEQGRSRAAVLTIINRWHRQYVEAEK